MRIEISSSGAAAGHVLPHKIPFSPKSGHIQSLPSARSARSWGKAIEPSWDEGQQPQFGLALDSGVTAMEFDVGSIASGRVHGDPIPGVVADRNRTITTAQSWSNQV